MNILRIGVRVRVRVRVRRITRARVQVFSLVGHMSILRIGPYIKSHYITFILYFYIISIKY